MLETSWITQYFHLIVYRDKPALQYWTLLQCTLIALGPLFTKKKEENVKLRQLINFPRIFQQKEKFFENLTSGCYGNAFVGVTSKSPKLAKIILLVTMETWSHDNSKKKLTNLKEEPSSYMIKAINY